MMYYFAVAFYCLMVVDTSKIFRVPIFPVQQWNSSFVNNDSNEGYYVELGFGTPSQKLNVLIDTGSSNLAVLAVKNISLHSATYFQYNKSETFHTERKYISVQYTVGSWEAFIATDSVSVQSVPQPLIINANLACIEKSENFFTALSKWQGILGMAYSSIAKPASLVPFFDSLVQSKQVDNIFSLSMCGPFATVKGGNSEMVLGGTENQLYHGTILYTPIYQEWYYEVIMMDIIVGEKHWPKECSQLNTNHTIIDTGTSDFLLPHIVFSWVIQTMKSQIKTVLSEGFWERKQEVCYTNLLDLNFPNIKITLAEKEKKSFTLLFTPEMYLRRSIKNKMFCYALALGRSSRGTVMGTALLKGYYVVFDRQNKQIGFANLTCLSSNSDLIAAVGKPEVSEKEMKDCVYIASRQNLETGLKIAAYVVAALCLICAVPLLIMLMRWMWINLIKRRMESSENDSLIEE